MKISTPILSGFLLFCSLILTGCNQQTSSNEIVVGAVFPMTGPSATYGEESMNGIRLAMQELETQKVRGKSMRISLIDNKGEPVESANAIRKLISVDKAMVILGSVASSNTLAGAPIAQQAQVPLLTPASTNEKVTQLGDYIARTCFTDNFQGLVMATFAHNHLKKRKAAVIVDNSSDYSKGLDQTFRAKFKELGGNLIEEQFTYNQKDTDFLSLLRRVSSAKPDVVFLPGYYTNVGLILKQAHQIGLKVPFLGGDGWDSPKLHELAGPEAVKGHYLSTHFSAEDPDPRVQAFVKNYTSKYGERPGAMAALGYDALLVLLNALKRADPLTPEGVKNAINSTRGVAGITGTISIDSNRNAHKMAVVLETTATGTTLKQRISP